MVAFLRLTIGAIFLAAGLAKTRSFEGFAHDVQSFGLTNWLISQGIAAYLPWLEIAAALALLTRRLYLGALLACLGMSGAFFFAVVQAWLRGLEVSCGCFGFATPRINYPLHALGSAALWAGVSCLFVLELRRSRARNLRNRE